MTLKDNNTAFFVINDQIKPCHMLLTLFLADLNNSRKILIITYFVMYWSIIMILLRTERHVRFFFKAHLKSIKEDC